MNIINKFSQKTIECIKYYVYILVDPRSDKKVFYIGKGKGNRVFNHAQGAIKNPKPEEKYEIIRDILSAGGQVEYFLIKHNLSEEEAERLEASLIDYAMLGFHSSLTNVVRGKGSDTGVNNVEEIEIMYAAKEVNIHEPTILININKKYRPGMDNRELYDITRKYWRVNTIRANKAGLAFAVYKGIIRGIYSIKTNSWKFSKMENGRRRYEFEGEEGNEQIKARYLHKSVSGYRRRGAQNPIQYVNC